MNISNLSVKNKRWLFPSAPQNVPEIDGIPAEVAALAQERGVGDLEAWFNPTLKAYMPDPLRLKGMDEAIKRFCQAVRSGETVAIYGDYDVDGATSTALILRWLRLMDHTDAVFYIPDRMKEGYGPNSNAMEILKGEGVSLLLVVDSGTTAYEPLQKAKDLGMDAIIIDHHESKEEMPEGILVNPKRQDETPGFEYLCTAGLVFLFLVGVNRLLRNEGYFKEERPEPNLLSLLGIVALGTVADVVPLVGLNRAYVRSGLSRMSLIPGIQALSEAASESSFTTRTCGFVFGPCINAAGRISDTRLGTILLTTDNRQEAMEIAQRLVELNRERQSMQREMVDTAMEGAKKQISQHKTLIVYDESWHPGVVGIVASKLKDAYDRPTVVIGEGGKASCRSVDGFDIGRAVIRARDAGILVAGGGHAAAAGLTILPERIPDLQAFLDKEMEGFEYPPIKLDLVVQCGEITPEQVEAMQRMAPFGQGNPEPLIAVTGGYAKKVMVFSQKHVKVILAGPSGETAAILFRGVGTPLGDALAASEGSPVTIYGKAELNHYNGRVSVQIIPEDAIIETSIEQREAS